MFMPEEAAAQPNDKNGAVILKLVLVDTMGHQLPPIFPATPTLWKLSGLGFLQ